MNRWKKSKKKQGYLCVKRIQDFILSAVALAVLAPFMFILCLLIIWDDPRGMPIFAQIRCGKDGKLFRCYKLRTMKKDAEGELEALLKYNEMQGPVFKMSEDPRVTRMGRILRKTGLDELPQFFNVLCGDMALVGPRPPLPREVEKYNTYQWQRLSVTPGITCIWQIQPNRNSLSFDQWVEMDIEYIRRRSWLLDWKIMLKTGKAMINGSGV